MKYYPIMVKKFTDDEAREYHLKRLERLCIKAIKEDRFYQRKGYYFKPDFDEELLTRSEKNCL